MDNPIKVRALRDLMQEEKPNALADVLGMIEDLRAEVQDLRDALRAEQRAHNRTVDQLRLVKQSIDAHDERLNRQGWRLSEVSDYLQNPYA